jgi:hypothetical protein
MILETSSVFLSIRSHPLLNTTSMLSAIPRSPIFKSSVYIDNYIAGMQQSYAADFDVSNAKEKATLKKYYDHLEAFVPIDTSTNAYGEMAYPAGSKSDYCINFPVQLMALLNALGIDKLYLMQFIKTDFVADFPFENFTKKNQFKRCGGIQRNDVGYLFNVKHISKILPLFFFSRHYDTPVIFLFSATANVDICLRLCDDGNLHYNIPQTQFSHFIALANQLGLVTEGNEICQQYSVFYLNKPGLIGNTLNPKP